MKSVDNFRETLTPPLVPPCSFADRLVVDYVGASVDTTPTELARTLSKALQPHDNPEAAITPDRAWRGHRYRHAASVINPETGGRRCMVMWDDHHAEPFVLAAGTEDFDAPEVYRVLTEKYAGRWYPSQVDVALDFTGAGWFDFLATELLTICDQHNIEVRPEGDWFRKQKGRTLYCYSKSSHFSVKLYEYKLCHGYGSDVRLETTIAVKGRTRRNIIASTAPAKWLAMVPVVRELLDRLGVDLQAVKLGRPPKQPLDEADLRTLAVMAYPAFRRRLALHAGDIAAAWLEVMSYRDQTEAVRAGLMMPPVTACDSPGDVIHIAPLASHPRAIEAREQWTSPTAPRDTST